MTNFARRLSRFTLLLATCCLPALSQPFLFVANQNSNNISVVNTRDNAIAGATATGFSPAGLALSPDGTRLYATNPNSNLVTVYNAATGALLTSFAIGQQPQGIAADSARIYVTLQGSAALGVFNAATLQLQANIRVGFGPAAVAYAAANNRVYVANTYSSTLSVIDPTRIGTAASPVLSTINVPDSPIAVAVSSDGQTAWVACSAIPILARVNVATGLVENRISLPVSPAGLAISDDGSRAYVPGYGPQVVTIDLQTNAVVRATSLPACTNPRCVAMAASVSADGKLVFVANTSMNQISIMNADSGALVGAPVAVQQSPRAMVLTPAPRPTTSEEVTN